MSSSCIKTAEYSQMLKSDRSTSTSIHTVKWCHSNLRSQCDLSMLWGTAAYCVKLSCENLSRYWNKIESVVSTKCPYILLWKWCRDNKHFAQLARHHGGKTGGIDTLWRNYVIVTLYSLQGYRYMAFKFFRADLSDDVTMLCNKGSGFWSKTRTLHTLLRIK